MTSLLRKSERAFSFVFTGVATFPRQKIRKLALLGTVSAIILAPAASHGGQLPASAFATYDSASFASVQAGPFALYQTPLSTILPTQLNLGFTEIGKKVSAYDLLTPAGLANDLLTSIEPVVIGPGGKIYLLDGHHTLTSLGKSVYGASNPNIYINVVANYSNLTDDAFWAKMQASNFLLPLDNGVIKSVDPVTGAPIPSLFADMTNDPYRGLEYGILKNKGSKLFTTAANITGEVGSSIPGLDKTAALYSDFIWASAYRGANGGLGLAYLSPGDIAIATKWNLTGSNQTTMPVVGNTTVAQLPGYILATGGSITINGVITDATLAGGVLDGSKTGTFDQVTNSASFAGLRGIDYGTVTIGSTAPGFILQLGADNKSIVTLTGANTYTGGTTILAGTLNINSDAALGAARPAGATIDLNNVRASVEAANGIIFYSLEEGKGTLQTTASITTNRAIAVGGEAATLAPQIAGTTLTLAGEIVSVGAGGVGVGNGSGTSDLTINADKASAVVKVAPTSGSNSLFYGNWIVSKGILQASSDAALGNVTGPAYTIGQIVLDGGTFQAGASFDSVRSLTLAGGSTFDTNGFTTSFAGSVTDVQRTLTITNSNTTTAGAVTFGSLNISGTNSGNANGATSTLELSGGTAGTSVTFANGITRNDRSTLIISPSTAAALGSTEKVFSSTQALGSAAPAWMISVASSSPGANGYNFLTYGANGYVATTYGATTVSAATGALAVDITANQTLAANAAASVLKIDNQRTLTLGSNTLTLGNGVDPTGLILSGSGSNTANITGGTLAFGGSEAIIYSRSTAGTTVGNTISSTLTGTNGITIAGEGYVTLSNVSAGLSGAVNIDSGRLNLSAADALLNVSSVNLSNVKSSPAPAVLGLSASNTFASLNSVGSNSTIAITGAGTVLTIGQTGNADAALNNLGSSIQSTITSAAAAGSNAIVKAGSGMLDLSGATLDLTAGSNIAVDGGKLRVSASSFKNTNNIATASGSEVQFAQNGGGVFAGNITGAGFMHLIGGTLQLTGTGNTYSGGTVVEQGSTLSLTTANVSSGNADIINAGGLVVFDQATSGTYAGVISDGRQMNAATGPMLSGSLVKDDSTGASSGDLILAAKQAYTGGTFVEAGTLTLGVADAIATSSGVDLGRIGGPLGTGAAAAAGAATATLALTANNTLQGLMSEDGNNTAVLLNANTLTLNTASGTAWTFGGVISGAGGVTYGGAGREILTGTSTYTGATTVNGGTLSVNGSIASSALTTVNASGTLGGNGIVGNTVINGGVLSPGNSIGTLTVQGNLVLTSAASYLVEVSGTSADRTNVTGTATLGGTLTTVTSGAVTFGTAYTVLHADGGVSGTFAAMSGNPLIAAAVTYGTNDVTLSFQPNLVAFAGGSANQRNVAGALQGALANGSPGAFSPLFNLASSALPVALGQLSGETVTGSQQATFDAMNLFMGTMTDPFSAGRNIAPNQVSAFADEALAYAGKRRPSDALAAIHRKAPPMAPVFRERWNVWVAGFGGSRTTDGSATLGSNSSRSSLAGGAVGADYWLSEATVAGFSMAGGATSFSVANQGSGTADLFQAGAFIRHGTGSAYLSAAAAYGWQNIRTDRLVSAVGTDRLRSDFNANAYSGRIEVGNRWALAEFGGVGMTPYAAVQVTAFDLPAYAETSANGVSAFALNYAAKTAIDTRTELGLRSDKSFVVDNAILTLRGRAAWAHDVNADRNAQATFQTLPGASFVVNGAQASRNAALTSATAEMSFIGGWSVAATFDGEFSDTTRSYAGKGVVRYAW